MTIPFYCVFVTYLLIWVPRFFVMAAQAKQPGGYDNHHPREQQAKLEGRGQRAVAAHKNAFEAFAPFAAGVFVAHLAHADETKATIASIVFVVSRAIYPFLYIADLASARSAVWGIGALATGALYLLPLFP